MKIAGLGQDTCMQIELLLSINSNAAIAAANMFGGYIMYYTKYKITDTI